MFGSLIFLSRIGNIAQDDNQRFATQFVDVLEQQIEEISSPNPQPVFCDKASLSDQAPNATPKYGTGPLATKSVAVHRVEFAAPALVTKATTVSEKRSGRVPTRATLLFVWASSRFWMHTTSLF